MRIGIDARTISEKGGCRTYVLNLIKNLLKVDKENKYIIFYNKSEHLGTFKETEEYLVRPGQKYFQLIYDHLSMPLAVRKYKLDLIHTPKSATSFFYPIKNVVTILDVIPLLYPETERFPNRLYWKIQIPVAIKKADIIITISRSAKKDICQMFNVSENKIKVVYLCYNERMKPIDASDRILKKVKEKYHLPDKFILFVGTIQPRKNLDKLFRAYALLKNGNKINNSKLVICGRFGWFYKPLLNLLNELKIKKDIKFLNFIPDSELPYIYSLAELFVYPSQYEGFGLPVLEAMACGVPVITSNSSSLPEVAGNSAIKIDPRDTQGLSDSIRQVLFNEKIKNTLVKRGLEQAKKFSWGKCAKETLKIYEKIYNEK
jgi:glycosyltransferase involved in cell wall biosynthesis